MTPPASLRGGVSRRTTAEAAGLIALLLAILYTIGIGVTLAARLPWDLPIPVAVRIAGGVLAAVGAAFAAWVVATRRLAEVVDSSYATFMKLLRRIPVEERLGRTEPLVVAGPYRFVRHPMYTGVGGMALGIGVAVARTPALLGAALLCAWFAAVVAPYEEKELRALFGEAYDAYRRTTPRFLPIRRPRSRAR